MGATLDRAEAVFVGRESELKQLEEQLALAPAVISISGEPGLGKSALVRAFTGACRASGWTVAAPAAADPPLVGPRTTREQFLTRVAQLVLSFPDPGRLGQSSAPIPAVESGTQRERRLQPEVQMLARFAPAVLLIEDFHGDQRFAGWFARNFLADVLDSGRPLVVLLTGRPANLESLQHLGLNVSLGNLDKTRVRAYLEGLSRDLRPPLVPTELDSYVTKGAASPSLLTSLAVVLSEAER